MTQSAISEQAVLMAATHILLADKQADLNGYYRDLDMNRAVNIAWELAKKVQEKNYQPITHKGTTEERPSPEKLYRVEPSWGADA